MHYKNNMELKTEIDGLYKVANGVLLNKDNDALMAYKAQKKKNNLINELEKKYCDLNDRVSRLEQELLNYNKKFQDK